MEEEGPINVIVKTINNDVYNIRVTNATPISQLKDAIQETTSIEIDRQRLIYRGKVLTDESFVRDYNIEDGHTVHMVARPANYREIQETVNNSPNNNQSSEANRRTINIAAPAQPIASILRPRANLSTREETNEEIQQPAEPSLEYIRQGLLTMHTLFSTINTVSIPSSSSSAHDDSKSETILDSKPSAREETERTIENPSQLSSERRFFIGQWLDVKDTVSQWLEATILDIDQVSRRIFVHYNGWPQRWDEWIAFDSPRIAPFRSRTNHPSLSTSLSPTPNISVTHAPSTGSNDLRTILPELANVFRMLQPLVEELATLSEESMRFNQPSPVNPSTTYARGMPWDHYLNNQQPPSPSTSLASERKEAPPSGRMMIMEKESSMEQSDEKESPVSLTERRTAEEVDARLQLLTRDACPLFDRFGRILSDLSPHLWTRAMPGVNRPVPANRFDPFQSLESRLLSLLRERPPSPSPMQSYRAPISSQGPRIEPLDLLRGGFLRSGPIPGNEDNNENATTATNGSSNQQSSGGGRRSGNNNNGGSSSSGSGLEHHVDIHIAILSPSPSSAASSSSSNARSANVDSLSRTVANLTASLQAQAQSLAARTQELSDRTSAVSEITSAITEALRGGLSASSSRTETEATPVSNNENQQEMMQRAEEDVEEEGREERREPTLQDLANGNVRFDSSEVQAAAEEEILEEMNTTPQTESLEDLTLPMKEEREEDSLMPSSHDQEEQLPFFQIPNQSLQAAANYGTMSSSVPTELQTSQEMSRQEKVAEEPQEEEEMNSPATTPSASAPSSTGFLQRLRRSFFSSPR